MNAPATARPRKPLPFWLSFGLNLLVALVVVSVVQAFVVKVFTVPSGSMEPTLNVGDRIVANRLPFPQQLPERGDVVVFQADPGQDAAMAPSGLPWAPSQSMSDAPLAVAARWFGDVTGIGPTNHYYLVKRVIGLPGDTVECCGEGGQVLVNGEPLSEPYLGNDYAYTRDVEDCQTDPRSRRCFAPITVGEGELLVMGDHRANSADSVIACRGIDPATEGAADECFRPVRQDQVVGKVVLKLIPFSLDDL